jgi:hypothetical protein
MVIAMKRFESIFFPQGGYKLLFIVLEVAAAMLILFGCSHKGKVLMPPPVVLSDYDTIGVIEFSTNAENSLRPYITQNFIQYVQSAQPGTRILELGDQDGVLRSLGQSNLNPETIQLIGKKYNIDALILGHLEVSEIKPEINVYSSAKAIKARGCIEAALSTRILETRGGATLWTRLSPSTVQVARLKVLETGSVSFGISDPKEKYGKLIQELCYANTCDFRPYYAYRTVK